MTFIVQQPGDSTNPFDCYRVVLKEDEDEAAAKKTTVIEDYGRHANWDKARADADKWNGAGRPANEEGETAK